MMIKFQSGAGSRIFKAVIITVLTLGIVVGCTVTCVVGMTVHVIK